MYLLAKQDKDVFLNKTFKFHGGRLCNEVTYRIHSVAFDVSLLQLVIHLAAG